MQMVRLADFNIKPRDTDSPRQCTLAGDTPPQAAAEKPFPLHFQSSQP